MANEYEPQEEEDREPLVQEEDLEKAVGSTNLTNTVLWAYPELSDGALLTYIALKHFAWQDRETFVGQDTLAEFRRSSSSTIRRHLSELTAAGLITSKQRGLGRTNIWYIHILGDEKHLEFLRRWRPERHKAVQAAQNRAPQTAQNRAVRTAQERALDKDTVVTKTQNDNERAAIAASFSSHLPHNDKPSLIRQITAEFAPTDPEQAIQTYLGRFPASLITRAAEITRANSHATNPIAYLYGVIQRLQEQEATQTAAHQHVELEPELTPAEYEASLQALERVKQQRSQQE